MLVGLAGMALLDFFAFASLTAAVIAAAGLLAGFLLRGLISRGVEFYARVLPAGLFVYSAVLFLGEQLGLDRSALLAIITATTVVVFNLQFWSLSDPAVVNTERMRGAKGS